MKKRREDSLKTKFRKFWEKFWWVVWKDDSFKGWIISIIFLFVVIKFIFFPLLSLATGTSLPLAIVESCSMYHKGNVFSNFDNWWERHEIKYSNFEIDMQNFKSSFKNGFSKGDILFITGTKPEKIDIGDVIIFNSGLQKNPVIHRVISIQEDSETGERTFSTIGDNNNGQLNFETSIPEDNIVGKAAFRVAPSLGWIKLIFYENLRNPSERGFCREN